MFNLIKYRYVFLGISLLVIIPGVISLFLFGLNVGVDLAGGSNLTIRPQRPMKITEVETLLKPFNLHNLDVILAENKQVSGQGTIWVRLNTQVDKNVQDTIKKTVIKLYPQEQKLHFDFQPIPATGNNKAYTLLIITGFTANPQVNEIKGALNNLPNTTDPTKPASTTAPTAAATPQATGTPGTNKGPVVTPVQNPNATIPVNVEDVSQGTTTQIVNILTRSTITSSNNSEIYAIQAAFLNHNGPYFQVITSSEVGPTLANDTVRNAILAVLAASVLILLYIWFSFRKLARAWRYGACAIIALLHDVLVVTGVFSILGKFFGIQVDALFITGLLTVVGFSVHDTIVVFDRVRENLLRRTSETYEEVVNASLVQTMARSLNTSLTVLFTLLALFLFSGIGSSIHSFTLTLLIGIFSGTYSSIFNASMLLVIWEKGEMGMWRFQRREERIPPRRTREARELVQTRS